MAVTAMTVLSERWLDEVVLFGGIDNVMGADVNESFTLPAGLGDVALMEGILIGITLATPIAMTAKPGARVDILSGDGATTVDIVGVYEWFTEQLANMSAYVTPDPLVLWRQGERLRILSPELDSNASPTGDLRVQVKVVRVRPIESPARGPIRLVR